jgi:glycosyltransferase involved in cell wall biosynthesis
LERPGEQKIKLLYLLDSASGNGGGAEKLAASVLSALDDSRYERLICLTRPSGGPLYEQIMASDLEVVHLDRTSRYNVLPWLRLVRFLRKRKVDVIHSHKHGSNFWGAVLSLVVKIPVFLAHEHSWSYSGNRVRLLTDRFLIAPRATRMIAVSPADREAMIAVEHIDPAKIVMLPNGVVRDVPGDPEAVRAELGIPRSGLVLTCVGIRQVKRIDLVVRALGELVAEHQDAHLLLVGGHRLAPIVPELIEQLHLEDRVHRLGERQDVSTLLAATDIAVIASDREGAPLAVLEYMAAGCAIVATRVGGIPDMVREGVDALLVEPGNAAELAAAFRLLARDPALRKTLGDSAREREEREFSLEAVVRRTDELYRELLGQKGSG